MRMPSPLARTLLVIALVASVLVALVPSWAKARREAQAMEAHASLWAIVQAEREVFENDLDGNGKQDFWTRDVRGLASLHKTSSADPLIDARIAAADASQVDPTPLHGHLFAVVERIAGRRLDDGTGHGRSYAVCRGCPRLR